MRKSVLFSYFSCSDRRDYRSSHNVCRKVFPWDSNRVAPNWDNSSRYYRRKSKKLSQVESEISHVKRFYSFSRRNKEEMVESGSLLLFFVVEKWRNDYLPSEHRVIDYSLMYIDSLDCSLCHWGDSRVFVGTFELRVVDHQDRWMILVKSGYF